ncbi:MAG: hypothetical protein SVE93_04695 [Candidatus Thermoplasmatota archaeon]|nr:hypothetical protein [Candidatus Thermoplasmatota archaeon]
MDFIRKKKVEIIDLEGAKALLQDADRSLSSNLRVERIYSEIKSTMERLKQDTERLSKAKPKEGISDALRIRGVPNRDVMVSNLSAIFKVQVPEEKDYRTVLSFYRDISAALETPFGKLSYNIRFVKAVFPDEVKAVIFDVKKLRSLLNRMVAPVRKKDGTIKAIDHSRELIEEIEALTSSKVSDGENVSEDIEKEIESEKKEIDGIKSSKQWIKYETLEKELSEKEDKLKRKEEELEREISPIKKVLNLLKKEDETGKRTLLPEEREALNALLFSPLETILNKNVKEQLQHIKKALEGDTVIKAERKDKGLRDIEAILKSDFSFRAKEIKSLRKEIESIKNELSKMSIKEEANKIERRLEELERSLKRAHDEEERSERHKASVDVELSEKLSELSQSLSNITGKKIEIRI